MSELILQDIILNQVRRDKSIATIKLINNEILLGIIRGFDAETIIIDIEADKKQIMLYKCNIISVTPKKPILKDDVSNKNHKYFKEINKGE